jgi:hypothetical protein
MEENINNILPLLGCGERDDDGMDKYKAGR